MFLHIVYLSKHVFNIIYSGDIFLSTFSCHFYRRVYLSIVATLLIHSLYLTSPTHPMTLLPELNKEEVVREGHLDHTHIKVTWSLPESVLRKWLSLWSRLSLEKRNRWITRKGWPSLRITPNTAGPLKRYSVYTCVSIWKGTIWDYPIITIEV